MIPLCRSCGLVLIGGSGTRYCSDHCAAIGKWKWKKFDRRRLCACGQPMGQVSLRCMACQKKRVHQMALERRRRTCIGCKRTFQRKTQDNVGLYCSRHCYFRTIHRRWVKRAKEQHRLMAVRRKQQLAVRKPCVVCSRLFHPTTTLAKFCGDHCRRQFTSANASQKHLAAYMERWPSTFVCKECGLTFTRQCKRYAHIHMYCEPCNHERKQRNQKADGLYRDIDNLPIEVKETVIALRRFRQRVDKLLKGQYEEQEAESQQTTP